MAQCRIFFRQRITHAEIDHRAVRISDDRPVDVVDVVASGFQHTGLATREHFEKPGGIPAVIDRWSTAIADRVKLSPLAFAGHSEFGGLNRWCHIWAYKDAAERFAVRDKARKEGIWPPKGGQPGQTLVQENMLVVPAAFSPLH